MPSDLGYHSAVKTIPRYFLFFILLTLSANAELRLPNIFGDRMVLQRDQPVRIWGWADPGEQVKVRFAGQSKSATTGADGSWSLELDPLAASSERRDFRAGEITYNNVLVGDVWVLGGQSNMEAALRNIQNGDLEVIAANQSEIRLMTIPLRASPKPLDDFPRLDEYNSWSNITERKGDWLICSPENVDLFSAIGYVFGKRIHQVTGVPIGLVDTSWGGTTVEAWLSRPALEAIPESKPLLDHWAAQIAEYDAEASLKQEIKRWEQRAKKLKAAGKPAPDKPTKPKPSPAVNRNNPAAAYNGVIAPFERFNIKGALFYQGINNAVGGARPQLYAKTYTALIPEWRRVFGQAELPFGIIQMVSWGFPPNMQETETSLVSAAPFIREAQLKAHLAHPNTGFVCAYDTGHIQMHSPFKSILGERISRWALATQYGQNVAWKTPIFQKAEFKDGAALVSFDEPVHPKYGGRARIEGFVITGIDGHFHPAQASLESSNSCRVWSDLVKDPVAVRYAWATFPSGTLVTSGSTGLPVAPFRSDTEIWPDAQFENTNVQRTHQKKQLERAKEQLRQRKLKEAKLVLEPEDKN
ncbi:MAG: sialate O-acetylesterase [Pseudoalteromonas tetraodonis]